MNFSKIWVNKLRPPFNTSSCIKLLPDFQADVLREFIDRATRATHTHKHTLKAGARSSRSWLDTGAGGDCSLFGQNPRCSAFVGNILPFFISSPCNAQCQCFPPTAGLSLLKEIGIASFVVCASWSKQANMCLYNSVNFGLSGEKNQAFLNHSSIKIIRSKAYIHEIPIIQSYRIIPSHNLHLFTLPFLRRVCVQLQVTWATASIQGLEHLLLPEATLGVGIVWCIVWCTV